MTRDLKAMYREIVEDDFPTDLEIRLGDTHLRYEKVLWDVDGERRGLRYGENPDQPAALYKLVHGMLTLGGAAFVGPDDGAVTAAELLRFGKHPGKINLTDADNALAMLRWFERPAAAIMKHNNPSGAALGDSVLDAYLKADRADPVAAFGGCIVVNRALDKPTAEAVAARYAEVVAAPDFEEGALEVLAAKKNLRIMRIPRFDRLRARAAVPFLDLKSLIDGGIVAQRSFVPAVRSPDDFIPAEATVKGETRRVHRAPTAAEAADLVFGWIVESAVTSNSVIYVRDGVTLGIGTGEQDRVGVAEIARDKARRNLADRLSLDRRGKAYRELESADDRAAVNAEIDAAGGALKGACMISDGFFPFPDGALVGLNAGVTAILQPGGSLNDHKVIETVNAAGAAMVFSGQRSFKH